jgi:hypothetical protein
MIATRESWQDKTPAERHVAMTWMQRLKRVFNIDIETCERCKGQVKIIACIEDPTVIRSGRAHSLRLRLCYKAACELRR